MAEVNIMAKLPEDVRMKGYMLIKEAEITNDATKELVFTLLAYAYTCGQLDGMEISKDPKNYK